MNRKHYYISIIVLVLLIGSASIIDISHLIKSSVSYPKKQKRCEKIETIIIHFLPQLSAESIVNIDLTKSQIIFQQSGLRKRTLSNNRNMTFKQVPNPIPIKTNLGSVDLIKLKQNILSDFNVNDFCDKQFYDVTDGYWVNITFYLTDGEIINVDLQNSFTQNQIKLFKFVSQTLKRKTSDKFTLIYLGLLNRIS